MNECVWLGGGDDRTKEEMKTNLGGNGIRAPALYIHVNPLNE